MRPAATGLGSTLHLGGGPFSCARHEGVVIDGDRPLIPTQLGRSLSLLRRSDSDELQRDWSRTQTSQGMLKIALERGGAFGSEIALKFERMTVAA